MLDNKELDNKAFKLMQSFKANLSSLKSSADEAIKNVEELINKELTPKEKAKIKAFSKKYASLIASGEYLEAAKLKAKYEQI